MKKTVALLLSIVMLLSCLSAGVFAASSASDANDEVTVSISSEVNNETIVVTTTMAPSSGHKMMAFDLRLQFDDTLVTWDQENSRTQYYDQNEEEYVQTRVGIYVDGKQKAMTPTSNEGVVKNKPAVLANYAATDPSKPIDKNGNPISVVFCFKVKADALINGGDAVFTLLTSGVDEKSDALFGCNTTDGTSNISVAALTEEALTTTAEIPGKTVKSLAVKTEPTKKTYTYGETFDPTGMVLTATFEDDTTADVSTGFTFSPNAALSASDTSVTITYKGKTTTQAITVNKIPLTITGLTATDRAYDGTTTVALSGGTLTGQVSGDDVSATMPTWGTISDANVGENKAVSFAPITLSGAAAGNYTLTQPTVTVKISQKAVADPTILLDPATYEYDGNAKQPTVTVKDGDVVIPTYEYSVAYSDNTNISTNETKAKVTVTNKTDGDHNNYTITQKTAEFTITAKPLSNLVVSIEGWTYGETPATPVLTGNEGNGQPSYTYKAAGSDTFVAEQPSNAGTHTIKVNVPANGNYQAGEATNTFTIRKAANRATLAQNTATIKIGNTSQLPSVSNPDGTVTYEITGALTGCTVTDAGSFTAGTTTGTCTVTASVAGDGNHEAAGFQITVTVVEKDPQNLTFTGPESDKTYGDADFALTATNNTPSGGEISYSSSNAQVATISNSGTVHIVAAGEVTFTATAAATDDYAETSKTVTLTINQKALSVVDFQATSRPYNGTNVVAITSGGLSGKVDGDDVSATIPTQGTITDPNAGSGKAVAFDAITLSGSAAANYTLTQPTGLTVDIAKATAPTDITLAKSIYYKNTTAQTIAATDFTGWPESAPAGTVTFKVESTPSAVGGEASSAISSDGFANGSFKLTNNVGAELVGKTATWTVLLDSTNYATTTATVNVTLINKSPVTFTVNGENAPESISAVYNGSAYTPTVALKDYTAVNPITQTWSKGSETLQSAPKDVGTYTLKLSYEDDVPVGEIPGHVGEATIAVTITAKPVGVEWTHTDDLTYTGTVQAPTATAKSSDVVSGDSVTLGVRGGQTNAGTNYTAEAYVVSTDTNYTIVSTEPTKTTSFSIGKAALTVTAKPKTIPYGAAAANDGVEYSGFVNSETSSVLGGTLAYAYGSYQPGSDVGSYDIVPSGLTSSNYEITFTKGTMTVEPLEAVISWPNEPARQYTYDGTAQLPVATVGNRVNSDDVALTVTGAKTDASTEPYTATVTGITGEKAGNYKLPEAVTTTFTISKATWTTPVEINTSAKYGAADSVDLAVLIADGGTAVLGTVPSGFFEENSVTVSGKTLSFELLETAAVGETASIPLTVSGATNYNDYRITANIYVTNKDTQALSFAEATVYKVYGDTVFTVTPTKSSDGGTVAFSSSNTAVAEVDAETGAVTIKRSGTAVITATAAETDKYSARNASYTLEVHKTAVTVKAYNPEITVGDTAPDLSNPVKGTHYTVSGLVGEDALTGTIIMAYDPEEVDTSKTGTYTITISGATVPDLDKYEETITYVSGTLTVKTKTSPGVSGGGSSSATHKIELPADTAHGKFTVSPEKAAKGDKVTITAKSDTGYKAEKPVVTDKDGKEIPLTENADGTWSFIMPDGDVKVSGKFVEDKKPDTKEKFVDVPADAWYHDDVYWAVDKGITTGVDDTHFAPNADCTRAQFVTFLWRAAGKPAPTSTANPFADVAANAYYYDAVLWAVEKGITNGTDDTHFSPDMSVTRAQAITFLYRYEQSIGKGFTGLWAFQLDYPDAADVPEWAYEAFCWMTMEGIVKGSDGKLLPGAICPRCEVVALLARIFGA